MWNHHLRLVQPPWPWVVEPWWSNLVIVDLRLVRPPWPWVVEPWWSNLVIVDLLMLENSLGFPC